MSYEACRHFKGDAESIKINSGGLSCHLRHQYVERVHPSTFVVLFNNFSSLPSRIIATIAIINNNSLFIVIPIFIKQTIIIV